MKITLWVFALFTVSFGFGCTKGEPKPANSTSAAAALTPAPLPTPSIPRDGKYVGKGVVKSVDMKLGSVEIDHEAMPEVMPQAMVMIYYVNDKTMLNGLKAGDNIEFTLEYKHPTETVVDIKKVG